MLRLAVFCGPALRRNLSAARSRAVAYDFFPPGLRQPLPDLRRHAGALVEPTPGLGRARLAALRTALDGRPLASLLVGVSVILEFALLWGWNRLSG